MIKAGVRLDSEVAHLVMSSGILYPDRFVADECDLFKFILGAFLNSFSFVVTDCNSWIVFIILFDMSPHRAEARGKGAEIKNLQKTVRVVINF